jgi:Insect pheromone-binding family, A10/OS-D
MCTHTRSSNYPHAHAAIKPRRSRNATHQSSSRPLLEMPKFEFFAIIALLFVVASIVSCEETYDVKYDNVDVDEILKSERLLSNYINCLMEEGPCTEDGRDLKDTLPDAICTDCSKCTEKQKEGSNKIMHFM